MKKITAMKSALFLCMVFALAFSGCIHKEALIGNWCYRYIIRDGDTVFNYVRPKYRIDPFDSTTVRTVADRQTAEDTLCLLPGGRFRTHHPFFAEIQPGMHRSYYSGVWHFNGKNNTLILSVPGKTEVVCKVKTAGSTVLTLLTVSYNTADQPTTETGPGNMIILGK